MREAVRETLRQIRKRCPKDFEDLQRLVRDIVPYDGDKDRSLGEWIEDQPTDDPSTWGYGFDRTPGVIKLREPIPNDIPAVALVAHELGHAATTEEDRKRRGPCSDEWASEGAADWYAYKWGFGRIMAKWRKCVDFMHHGPNPGDRWTETDGDYVLHGIVTRNFVAHIVKQEYDPEQVKRLLEEAKLMAVKK